MHTVSDIFLTQWHNLRILTYDYLTMLGSDQLALTLSFPESRSIGHQFWCMLGAQESYTRVLKYGEWLGFSCSLDTLPTTNTTTIQQQMVAADAHLTALVEKMDLQAPLKNGKHGYEIMQRLIEHETLHHGQLINLMFYHHLPMPDSWRDEWAL